MANRALIVTGFLLLALAAPGPGQSPTPTPPTGAAFPIKNGKLITPLDANQFKIVNAPDPTGADDYATKGYVDTHGGGGGGGAGLSSITGDNGTATGLTLTISGTNVLTDPVFTLGATLSLANGGTGATTATGAKTALSLQNVDNTSDANKPVSTATQTALDLKADSTAVTASLAAFTGSSNIVTLGTIATGTWNATAISASKLPTLDAITAPAANLSLNSHKIISLADPTNATDATNKQYVDAVAVGGVPHPAVAAASTANLTLSGEQTIDGVATSASRVLAKNQTAGAENGIYVTAAGAWTRATDADTGAEIAGSVFVSGGTVNAATTWGVTTPQPITINTTAVAYTITGSNTIYSAGTGLQLVGSQFSLATMAANTFKGRTGTSGAPADLTVSDAKTVLSITNVENTALSTWAGSTNVTTLGTIATGTIPLPRLSPAPTTAGGLLMGITNPNATAFPRLTGNPTSAADTRTPTQMLGDIGAAAAFTASSPLSLSAGTLSIATASASATGALTNSDWTTFSAKVPPGRTLTTTAPLRISTATTPLSGAPGSDLSANRTIDMPASTNSVDGYLTSVDHTTFAGKANVTTQATFSVIGTAPTPRPWPTATPSGAPAAVAQEAGTMQSANLDGYATLPAANSLPPGSILTYMDAVTTKSFGRNFIALPGTDRLDGNLNSAAIWVRPFIAGGKYPGGGTYQFETNGVDNWFSVYANARAIRLQDAADATKEVTFDVSGQTSGTPGVIKPGVASGGIFTHTVTVVPTDNTVSGVVHDIGPTGTVAKSRLTPSEVLPVEYVIGTAGSNVVGGSFPVTPFDGTVDTVRIAGTLTAPIEVIWPPANAYDPGQTVALVDASGSTGPSTAVTVTSAFSNNFAGSGSFVFSDTNGRKEFTSDGVSNWTVSQTKVITPPYTPLNLSGTTFTLVSNTGAVKQNALINLANGVNNLVIPAPFDGMDIDLVLVQPGSGAAGTLNLPTGSKVSGGGAGLVTLTATNSAVDTLHGRYVGNLSSFLWNAPVLNYTSAALPAAPSGLADAGGTTSGKINLSWTDNASNETGFELYRATTGGGGFTLLAGGTLAANTTSYSDTTVQPATAYTYRIRAFNSGGFSAYNTSASISSLAGGPPADVLEWHFNENTGNAVGGTGGLPNGNMRIPAWTTSTESGSGAAFAPIVGMATINAPTITPTGPSSAGATSYQYHVIAWKTVAGNLYHNGHTVGSTANGPTLANFSTTNYNVITWTDISGADYYEIYRTVGGSTTGKISSTGPTLTPGSICSAGTCTFNDGNSFASGTYTSSLSSSTHIYDTTTSSPATVDYSGSQIISVSFWIKTTALSGISGAAVDIVSGGALTFKISAISGNRLQVTFPGNTLTLTGTVSDTTLNNGSWHNVVVVMDNSTAGNTLTNSASDNIRVYVDGPTQQTITPLTQTRAGAKAFANAAVVVGSTNFVGFIDDVRIYKHALTTTPTTGEIALIASGHAQ